MGKAMRTNPYQSLCLKWLVNDGYNKCKQQEGLCWRSSASYCNYVLTDELNHHEQHLLMQIHAALGAKLELHRQYEDITRQGNIIWCMRSAQSSLRHYQAYQTQDSALTWFFLPDVTALYHNAHCKKELWQNLMRYALQS